jgi:rhamnose utilization protein RhaD (predicted bifunctional aldolase and dehydrogenase)
MCNLSDLAAAIQRIGRDPLLTQGSAGNASIKQGNTLWITASGQWLSDAGPAEEAFVRVRIDDSLRRFGTGAHAVAIQERFSSRRPSMETWMHLVIPHKVVIHLHSVSTVACSVRADGPEMAAQRLEGMHWTWVPYAPSGRPLARRIAFAANPMPGVFVLANHGLVVAANEVKEALVLISEVERRLGPNPRPIGFPNLSSLEHRIDVPNWRPAINPAVHSLALDRTSLEHVLDGALYPCHWAWGARHMDVLYGDELMSHALGRFTALHGYEPSAMLIPGEGVLMRNDAEPEVIEQISGLAEVALRLPEGARVRYLSDTEIAGLAVELGVSAAFPAAMTRASELSF